MHTMQIVYQITYLYQVRLMRELIFVGFHGISGIRHLSPYEWEASTPPSGDARNACQPDIMNYTTFYPCLSSKKSLANARINYDGPNAKALGLVSIILQHFLVIFCVNCKWHRQSDPNVHGLVKVLNFSGRYSNLSLVFLRYMAHL